MKILKKKKKASDLERHNNHKLSSRYLIFYLFYFLEDLQKIKKNY